MKKLLALLLALVMVLSFAACAAEEEPEQTEEPSQSETETPEDEEPSTEAATYTLGLGTVVSTASTNEGNAQVDATFAAVVTDAEGVIVAIDLDVAQSKIKADEAGVFSAEGFDNRTKTEKGPDYGMAPASPIGAEWDAQMEAFEAWAIGKTIDYIVGVELVESNGHQVAANEADLYAGCTMDITAFQGAVADSANYTKEFTAEGAIKLGLGVVTSGAVNEASAEKDGSIEMYSDYAAIVTDEAGVILAACLDAIQPKIGLALDGTLTPVEDLRSKYTKKEDYNMAPASPIGAEWYTQADAYCAYLVGQTGEVIGAMELVESNGHMITTDEALLAGCTMSIPSYNEAVAKAAVNAD